MRKKSKVRTSAGPSDLKPDSIGAVAVNARPNFKNTPELLHSPLCRRQNSNQRSLPRTLLVASERGGKIFDLPSGSATPAICHLRRRTTSSSVQRTLLQLPSTALRQRATPNPESSQQRRNDTLVRLLPSLRILAPDFSLSSLLWHRATRRLLLSSVVDRKSLRFSASLSPSPFSQSLSLSLNCERRRWEDFRSPIWQRNACDLPFAPTNNILSGLACPFLAALDGSPATRNTKSGIVSAASQRHPGSSPSLSLSLSLPLSEFRFLISPSPLLFSDAGQHDGNFTEVLKKSHASVRKEKGEGDIILLVVG